MTWLTSVASRPGADLLAVAASDGWLGIWMPTDNRVVATQALGQFVNKVGWTVDGGHLLATSGDALLVLSPDGKERVRAIETKHAELRTFDVHPQLASLAVTTGGDGVVRIWDITTGAQYGEVMAKQGKGSGGGTSVAMSSDTIMVGYDSGYIAFCDHDGKNVGAVELFRGYIASLASLPKRKSFLAGGGKGKMAQIVVEPTTFRVAHVFDDPPKPFAVNTIEVAPDERWVAACSDNTALYFEKVGAYQQRLGETCWGKSWERDYIVSAACFVPGTQLIATSHFTGVVKLWNPSHYEHVVVRFGEDSPRWTSSADEPIEDPVRAWDRLVGGGSRG